jgi:hypothetical protein
LPHDKSTPVVFVASKALVSLAKSPSQLKNLDGENFSPRLGVKE